MSKSLFIIVDPHHKWEIVDADARPFKQAVARRNELRAGNHPDVMLQVLVQPEPKPEVAEFEVVFDDANDLPLYEGDLTPTMARLVVAYWRRICPQMEVARLPF